MILDLVLQSIEAFRERNGVAGPVRGYVSVNDARTLSGGELRTPQGMPPTCFGRQNLGVWEWYFDTGFEDGHLRLESADVREEFTI